MKTSEEEAREYAESIINTVREPLIVLDHDLKVVTASRSFYDVFKVRPEETLGQLIYDLGNKQWDIPRLRQLLETLLPRQITLEDYEVEHEFTDIGRRTMLLNALEIQRKSGKERLILLAIEDITESKRQKNLLAESEERYRRLFETANDGMVLLEKAEGKITHANPAITGMLGYRHDELIGKGLIHIGFPDEIGAIQEILQTLEKDGILHYKDAPVQTKTGQIIDTDIYMVDKTRLVQCNIRDIAARKRMEEELRTSEERYRLLVEASNDIVWSFDLSSMRYTYCSTSVERILGYSQEEIKGSKLEDRFPQETKNKVVAAFDQVFKGETNSDQILIEADHRHKDGHLVWMEISAVMHRDNQGQPLSFTGVSREITERKHAEEALKEQSRTLNERNKELRCLYGISRLVENKDNSLDDILQGTVNLLPDSWQYPEAACARIKLEDRVYVTGNFRETSRRLAQDIISEKKVVGCVAIFYLEDPPAAHGGPFIKEERKLIDAVAERLGHIIGHVRQQTRLRRSEQKFRDIFHGSNDAVFIHDISGRFLEVNQVACSRLGYSREELLLMTTMDLDTDEYAGSGPQRFQDVDQQGSLVFESVHRCKDGSTIAVEISSRKTNYEGINCILSIARDITERKKDEQEMRPNMSTAAYKKSLQAQLDNWSTRIDKGRLKVRWRSTAVRKIITGTQLLNQQYPPRHRKIRIRKEIRWVAIFSVLIFLNLPALAFAQSSCPGIQVKIPNIKNSTGNIACGIFESPEGFPTKFLGSAKAILIKKIQKTQAQCDFSDIPPGTYAIAVIHDENMNSELDTNWMGLPTEGYGFSNTTIEEFGAPAFSTAKFRYDGQDLNLTIKLEY